LKIRKIEIKILGHSNFTECPKLIIKDRKFREKFYV